jgi:hypothetical protein
MVPYRTVVRINVPQTLNYQFLDQDRNIIPLNGYVAVNLEIKLQGEIYATIAGSISDATLGKVTGEHTFTEAGIWMVQFVAVDGSNNLLEGEPLQFRGVKNVVDAGLVELLPY